MKKQEKVSWWKSLLPWKTWQERNQERNKEQKEFNEYWKPGEPAWLVISKEHSTYEIIPMLQELGYSFPEHGKNSGSVEHKLYTQGLEKEYYCIHLLRGKNAEITSYYRSQEWTPVLQFNTIQKLYIKHQLRKQRIQAKCKNHRIQCEITPWLEREKEGYLIAKDPAESRAIQKLLFKFGFEYPTTMLDQSQKIRLDNPGDFKNGPILFIIRWSLNKHITWGRLDEEIDFIKQGFRYISYFQLKERVENMHKTHTVKKWQPGQETKIKVTQIRVYNKPHFDAAVTMLQELGYHWYSSDKATSEMWETTMENWKEKYIILRDKDKMLASLTSQNPDLYNVTELTLDELAKYQSQTKPYPETFFGEKVSYRKDGLKIGCTALFSKKVVQGVYNLVTAEKEVDGVYIDPMDDRDSIHMTEESSHTMFEINNDGSITIGGGFTKDEPREKLIKLLEHALEVMEEKK